MNSTSSKCILIFCVFMMSIDTVYANSHLRGHIEESSNYHHQKSRSNQNIHLILGFLCIIGAAAFLWYNERRQEITLNRLEKANTVCISVNSFEENPNTNHQLIHISGESLARDFVVDQIFGISLPNCIKLVRTVEMYQWVRKSSKRRTRYYVQEWKSVFQSECKDEHSNDESKWIIQAETQVNLNVWVGAYLMSKSLAEQTNVNETVILTMTNATAAANHYNQQQIQIFNNYEADGNFIYFQQNRGTVTLNDLRVSFSYSKTGPTSIVSQQLNYSFTPYIIHDKFDQTLADTDNMESSCTTCFCCCCKICKSLEQPLKEIDWIYESILTQNQVFNKVEEEHVYNTNVHRVAGYVFMGIGFTMIFYPILWLISWFPLIGNFLATITGFVFFLVSLIISIPFSTLTIAFARLFYHAKYGVALILLSGAIGTGIYFYLKSQS